MEDQQPRYHAIDHLRATMISIVVFGHALLPYTTIPRPFKDPQTHVVFDFVAVFLYSFAMPVFFVTAGFSTALIYYRKGARGLARSRLLRIFLPLVIAYFLLTPLTRAAFMFSQQVALTGTVQAGFDALLAGDWIRWGKAYHLWFLVSLLLYSALAVSLRWGVLRFAIAAPIRSAARCFFSSRWPSAWLALITAVTMVPAYVVYGADATTLPMQLALFGFFVVGWLLYLHRDLLPALQQRFWPSLVVAVVILPLTVWSTRERLMAPDDSQLLVGLLAGFSNSVLAACMTFAFLGIFQTRYNRASAFGRYISDASYWLFLIHYPLLIAVAGMMTIAPLPATIKYLLTIAIVLPIVILSYHYAVRSTRLGLFLTGGKLKAGQPRVRRKE